MYDLDATQCESLGWFLCSDASKCTFLSGNDTAGRSVINICVFVDAETLPLFCLWCFGTTSCGSYKLITDYTVITWIILQKGSVCKQDGIT